MGDNQVIVLAVLLSSAITATFSINPANILVYNAIGSHSIRISMFPVVEALAERGHSVTYLSGFHNFEDPQNRANLTYFTPKKWSKAITDFWSTNFYEFRKNHTVIQSWLECVNVGITSCQILYSDEEFVEWVKRSKYDLIIMEGVVNDCALGLVHLFNSKLVVFGSSTVFPWYTEAYGFPEETSTMIDASVNFIRNAEEMSFMERLQNALLPIRFHLEREYKYFPALEQITRSALGLKENELPPFKEIEEKTSLVLLSTHFTVDLPRSLPPHVIPIGGAVINKTQKPLSKNAESFLNRAKSGFIYISFGSIGDFTGFDYDVQYEFVKSLHSFPEIRFLWKQSIDLNKSLALPENVMLVKWTPQQTVLAHPNIKAFITHCGMGSVAETVHYAVPAILIPVFAEQENNANVLSNRGVGIRIEVLTLKAEQMEHAISELLHNEKYRFKMQKLSNAFKDRLVPPIETAVWWIEYILRHDTNEYLVPISVRQAWWKKRQIDVWLFLGATCLLLNLVLGFILFRLFQICRNVFISSTDQLKQKSS